MMKETETVFDQDLETHQVVLDLQKINEGIIKVTDEVNGSTWLPISVIRNPQFISAFSSNAQEQKGYYSIEVNREYWEEIYWME